MSGPDGRISKRHSPWFSSRLTRSNAPWAYAKGGQPFRTIAALEALAMLFALRCFKPGLGKSVRGPLHFPAFTDNQGNSHALNRLMTSKFPLVCVIMEIATVLDDNDWRMEVEWTPREQNAEADALANGDYGAFMLQQRITADPAAMQWTVLDKAMADGLKFYEELPGPSKDKRAERKRPRHERLRFRDPW